MRTLRILGFTLAAGLLAAVAHAAHLELGERASERVEPAGRGRLLLPDGDALRGLSLGQRTTLADLYWLRFVQYAGTAENMKAGLPSAHAILDLVTDLDPLYGYAYELGGVALSTNGRIEDSNRLLEKGVANVPGRWRLPFYLAFNHWYELDDVEEGARWLSKAAAVPGAPGYVRGLTARLYNTSGRTDVAIEFFTEQLRATADPGLRAELEERLSGLYLERDLQLLDRAIAAYAERTGRPPASLADLVGTVLAALPVPRDGGAYRYDPEKREALPPTGERERLKASARKQPRTTP